MVQGEVEGSVTTGRGLTSYLMLKPWLDEYAGKLEGLPKYSGKILWYVGWWDGPISGVLYFEGQLCWFEQISQNEEAYERDDVWYRRYLLVKMTDEQFTSSLLQHRIFEATTHKKQVDYCPKTHTMIPAPVPLAVDEDEYFLPDVERPYPLFDPKKVEVVGYYER